MKHPLAAIGWVFCIYVMEKYIERAKILVKFFNIYGYGNFDLSLEEIARIIEILDEKKDNPYLEANLQELYERLHKTRMG